VVPLKPNALRAGEVVELDIEKGVYRGLGLARHNGEVVFVPHVLPGERVRARVQKSGRGYAHARLEGVLRPAAERRTPPCPYVPRCGGCAHQEMEYAAQLRLKEAVLREAFDRGGVEWTAAIPVRPSPERAWRTRVAFHLSSGPSGLRLGLFEEGSHRVVDVEVCLQLSDGMNRTARALLEALRPLSRVAARVKGIELAESGDESQRVAVLQIDGSLNDVAELGALRGRIPGLTGLALLSELDDRVTFVMLEGDPYVRTRVAGLELRAHACAFFQGNRFLVEPLVETVLAALPPGGPVLDLYSGVGLFALPAARRGATVRAAELSEIAAEDARVNAEAAGLTNVEIEAADVETALAAWAPIAGETVILDPPRSGAEPSVIAALAARAPDTIVYVSCDPPTLGRDLKRLGASGYKVHSVEAFDLFPDTFHVETVALLRR
jgi:23S rRNA (uracil1939-C5)-methyltransferase